MNITSAKYTMPEDAVGRNIKATIDGQEMFVPINAEGNLHWQAIKEWVSKGNKIAEAD